MTLPANLPPAFVEACASYSRALREIARSHIAAAQPEDQLKAPVQQLIRSVAARVETRTEVRVGELDARPDIGVAVQRLLCGYVELKAPGTGARTAAFRDRNKAQWERLRVLPNLLYTDGLEFALYRDGKPVGGMVRLADSLDAVGESPCEAQAALHTLLLDFLIWQPIAPKSPRALATALAPLCRLLRDEVAVRLRDEHSNLALLSRNIRDALFADVEADQFADIYAQTLTYSLLLARLNGETALTTENAARDLESGHKLLASVLRHMTNPAARAEVEVPVSILERMIAAVDPAELHKNGRNPWLYFYEDFLTAYDRKLRGNRGVYYTPVEVIGAQVRLAAELLETRFGKPLAFADENVFLLDPAAGTSAYPLVAMEHALDKVEARFGKGAVPAKATQLARNVHAFELLVGPYAVGHLRISQMIRDAGGELPADGIHVYLTDTLESPHAEIPPQNLFSKPLTDEHKRAAAVKKRTPIMVCLGNPPYDRESYDPAELDANPRLRRKGGWVRYGDADTEGNATRPILRDFIEPAERAGAGKHLKNLYNDYVYFWRWALWKMFENQDARGPGIVTFITASSYLRGPGFVGMRRKMREAFDELWIIDLEGDQLGARKTENVFAIQTPVAIAIGARYTKDRAATPAKVRYTKIVGTQAEKLAALDKVKTLADLEWRDCFADWEKPLLPEGTGNFSDWSLLTNLLPWQHSGVQFKRTWPIGETAGLLTCRWSKLMASESEKRGEIMRETPSRLAKGHYGSFIDGGPLSPIASLSQDATPLTPVRYAFRSLDRQWILPDARLCDRPRPDFWNTRSEKQVYLTSLLTGILGSGPAAVACAEVPDLHHFRGSFGGRDVIPLWRNAAGTEPNVTRGLVEAVGQALGATVLPEDLFAYAYAILSAPDYVATFSEELTIPGPRVPVTKDKRLFAKGVKLGRRLIWLHTYGQRMVSAGEAVGQVPQGKARCIRGIPGTAEDYPEAFSCEDMPKLLRVGKGEFGPVSKDVWEFSVSGLAVVKSWLRYRMKAGAGRSSSPLDEVRPETWTAQMTQELLELLWVLEATVAMRTDINGLLAAVIAGPVFEATELPMPTDDEREPPKAGKKKAVAAQDEMAGMVAEARAEYVTKREKRSASGKFRAPCRDCGKETPQKPTGPARVRRGVLCQTCVCSLCSGRNEVELSVLIERSQPE